MTRNGLFSIAMTCGNPFLSFSSFKQVKRPIPNSYTIKDRYLELYLNDLIMLPKHKTIEDTSKGSKNDG